MVIYKYLLVDGNYQIQVMLCREHSKADYLSSLRCDRVSLLGRKETDNILECDVCHTINLEAEEFEAWYYESKRKKINEQ